MLHQVFYKLFMSCVVLASLSTSVRANELSDKSASLASLATLGGGAAKPSIDAPVRRGMLYRITYQGQSSYLFGTVHAGKDASFPLDPEVTRALASANKLVLELDTRNGEPIRRAVGKYGTYDSGDTISNHLSPQALRKLNKALDDAGITMTEVARFRPWMVANLLLGAQMAQRGFQRGQAVESYLLAAAQEQRKKVLQLENADYQLSLFTAMNDAQQESYLLENIADMDDGAAVKKSEDLMDAWANADSGKVDDLLRELSRGNTVSANFLVDTVLGKRNVLMARSIESIMRDNQTAFIGVGLLHLSGPNGLPTLLKQRGYAVEKMY